MIIQELFDSLTPEEKAAITLRRDACQHLLTDDSSEGVQKRFDPAVEAFMTCYLHEARRARARGVKVAPVFEGVIATLGRLIHSTGLNMSIQAMGDATSSVALTEFVASQAMQCAMAFATGTMPLVEGSQGAAYIDATGGAA